MKSTYRIGGIALLMWGSVWLGLRADSTVATVTSPQGGMVLDLLLDENDALYYQVQKDGVQLIAKSALGINTSAGDFSAGLVAGEPVTTSVDDTYSLPSGKKSTYINRYNELRVPFTRDDKRVEVVVRMYDDGLAYRYELDGTGNLTVYSELSECSPAAKDEIYSQVYSRDYKNVVEESDWELESCLQHTSLPLLVKTGDNYLLLSEAGVDGTYAASQLYTNDETQAFVYRFVGADVETSLPFHSPWRMVMAGSLASMVESTLPENLSEPTTLTDLAWIKPGRAAWSYGGDDTEGFLSEGTHTGYLSQDRLHEYIDWASEMGWEYFTLDRAWEEAKIGLNDLASYARDRQVGLFVWVNQNMLPTDDTGLNNRMLNWENAGIKGIKVDFWEDDSQDMMKRYEQVLRIAAQHNLMVDLYSCTKPTGLQRTWPNLLSSEAVLSNAYYAESPNVITAAHNINSAIVRGSLGATDYAPVDFADKDGKIHYGTTWAHQLALSVVFESGLLHLNDAPDNYRYHVAKGFLQSMPATWDDTKCLEAAMNDRLTVARRNGDDWYVAVLAIEPRAWSAKLDFLDADRTYNAYIYRDGTCPSDVQFEYREGLRSTDALELSLLSQGGAVVLLSPSADYARPEFIKYEAESADNLIPFGVAVRTDVDSLCSGNEYVASIGNGRALTFRKVMVPQSGTYALTFYYTAATSRFAYVEVNDVLETRKEYTFQATGADSGSGLGMKTILVDLNAAAENTIEFGCAMDYAPSIDRIELSWVGEGDTALDNVESDHRRGVVYARDMQIIMQQSGETQYVLFNTTGQQLASGSFEGGTLAIPVAERGVYLLKLETEGVSFTEKVLVD